MIISEFQIYLLEMQRRVTKNGRCCTSSVAQLAKLVLLMVKNINVCGKTG